MPIKAKKRVTNSPTEVRRRLIAEYKRSHDVAVRNQLIEQLMPLLQAVATKIHRTLPPRNSIDIADLESAGVFGLIEAIDRYDPSRGVNVATYCLHRARGAMLDWLRSLSNVRRLTMQSRKRMTLLSERHYKATGEKVAIEDLVGTHGWRQVDAKRVARPECMSKMLSTDAKAWTGDDGRDVSFASIMDGNQQSPLDILEQRDTIDHICSRLNRRGQLIVKLYYVQGLTMKQVAAVVGVTESRVSQLVAMILSRLRSVLNESAYAA